MWKGSALGSQGMGGGGGYRTCPPGKGERFFLGLNCLKSVQDLFQPDQQQHKHKKGIKSFAKMKKIKKGEEMGAGGGEGGEEKKGKRSRNIKKKKQKH